MIQSLCVVLSRDSVRLEYGSKEEIIHMVGQLTILIEVTVIVQCTVQSCVQNTKDIKDNHEGNPNARHFGYG